MKKIKILVVAMAMLLCGCGGSAPQDGVTLIEEPFKGKQKELKIGEVLPIEVLHTENIIVSDSYILTYSNQRDPFITLFDRRSYKEIGSILQKGRARDEVAYLPPIKQIDKRDGHLRLLIRSIPSNINWLDVDSTLMTGRTVLSDRQEFKGSKQRNISMSSGMVYDIGDGAVMLNFQEYEYGITTPSILLYDLAQDQVLCHIPKLIDFDPNRDEYQITAGNIALSSDCKRYATALFNLDMVGFFDIESGESKNIFFSEESMKLHPRDEDRDQVYYRTCTEGDRYFYAVRVNDNDRCSIQLFEWDGTPKVEYLTSENIRFLSVDESCREIYAVILDDEGEFRIVRYDL